MTQAAQRNYQPWTDAERDFLIQTHEHMSAVEQAKHLNRDYDCLCFQRMQLIRAGLIAQHTRRYGPIYTDDDRARIVELAQAGYSVSRIARALKRSYSSMLHEVGQMGGIKHLRSNPLARVWTPSEVGVLFGLAKNTVVKWIQRGWIDSTRNTAPRPGRVRTDRLIPDEALQVFMTKREYWPAWSPALIIDPDWQDYGRDLRSAGDWVSCGEIAQRHDIRLSRVHAWLREQRSSGITFIRYGVELFVWSADVTALVTQIQAYNWRRGTYKNRRAA